MRREGDEMTYQEWIYNHVLPHWMRMGGHPVSEDISDVNLWHLHYEIKQMTAMEIPPEAAAYGHARANLIQSVANRVAQPYLAILFNPETSVMLDQYETVSTLLTDSICLVGLKLLHHMVGMNDTETIQSIEANMKVMILSAPRPPENKEGTDDN
jgi:hypothetical protein